MGNESFPGGKVRPGRDADPSPPSNARSKIEYSYTSTLPKGLRGLWKGETYHIIIIYMNDNAVINP